MNPDDKDRRMIVVHPHDDRVQLTDAKRQLPRCSIAKTQTYGCFCLRKSIFDSLKQQFFKRLPQKQ